MSAQTPPPAAPSGPSFIPPADPGAPAPAVSTAELEAQLRQAQADLAAARAQAPATPPLYESEPARPAEPVSELDLIAQLGERVFEGDEHRRFADDVAALRGDDSATAGA